MAAQKFLAQVGGILTEVFALLTSGGAASSGAIPALNSAGQLDISFMPTGVGPDTQVIVASEALAAGAYVNIWSNAGVFNVRNADCSTSGNCALMDAGTFGIPGFSQVVLARAWANTLTEVLEYSPDGSSWTAISTGYTPVSHGGTLTTVSTTVSLTGITARFLRYSGKDGGGTSNFQLFEFRPS